MLISTILYEMRSNSKFNPKVSINSVVRKSYDKAEQLPIGIKNSFVSFTGIEKLGVNPKSKYNTPLGIYCYPSEYVLEKTSHEDELPMKKLPFAGTQPYGNIFNVAGNIIRIDTLSDRDCRNYLSKLQNMLVRKYPKLTRMSAVFNHFEKKSYTDAKFPDNVGGRFWYIMMSMAKYIGLEMGKENTAIIWNRLFRDIDIDCVVDMGSGIIHTAEPTQAVIFSLQSITNNVRVDNKYSSYTHGQQEIYGQYLKIELSKLKTMSRSKLTYTISQNPTWFKYIDEQDLRTYILDTHPSLLMFLTKITKEDLLTALAASNLTLFQTLFKNKNKPAVNRKDFYKQYGKMFSEPIYLAELKQDRRNRLLAGQASSLLTEADVVKLINEADLDTYSYETILCILLAFPNSKQILKLLFDIQKETLSDIYKYDKQLPHNIKQMIEQLFNKYGESYPNDPDYVKFVSRKNF